jgi:phosphoribosylanthranilate isomerase
VTWVKLCGMTERRDVELAVELGADAVGFVVYERSPRRVEIAEAAALGAGLAIARFLVTVGLPPAELLDAAERAEVSGVQPHGRHAAEAAAAAQRAGLDVLFPVSVADARPDLGEIPEGCVPLLDTKAAVPGGSGRAFDWELAAGVARPWVLAGGLNPGTVGAAVASLDPWGVDVASGVEWAPGVKDHDLMRAFVEALR